MAKHPTRAEQLEAQANREADRKAEMDAAFEKELARTDPTLVDSSAPNHTDPVESFADQKPTASPGQVDLTLPPTTSADRMDLSPAPVNGPRTRPEVASSNSLSPAEYGAPLDASSLPGQVQRRIVTLRAAAGDFYVPDEVLLNMALALEMKA